MVNTFIHIYSDEMHGLKKKTTSEKFLCNIDISTMDLLSVHLWILIKLRTFQMIF